MNTKTMVGKYYVSGLAISLFLLFILPINLHAASWVSTSTTLGYERLNSPLFSANGFMYAMGGDTSPDYEYAQLNNDGTLGPWTILPNFYVLTYDHLGGIAVGNNLYLIGGRYRPLNSYYYSESCYRTTISTTGPLGSFDLQPPLNLARSQFATVYANGFLYVLGGVVCDDFFGNCLDGIANSIEYSMVSSDGSLSPWTVNGPSITRNAGAMYGGWVRNSTIFIMDYIGLVEKAHQNPDGSLGAWDFASDTAPVLGPITLTDTNDVYIIGNGGIVYSAVYNPVTETIGPWTLYTRPVVEPRIRHSAISIGQYLYVVGGLRYNQPNPDYTNLHVVEFTPLRGPIAGFTADTFSGLGPLQVNFTDTSLFYPTNWNWDFGDGSTSNVQNPTHVYAPVTIPTCYSVRLIVSDALGTSTVFKSNYICVSELPPSSGFYATPTSGYGALTVNFTDTSANLPTIWNWNFGDGSTSNLQNPTHIYAAVTVPTAYTVRLITSNTFGSSTATKPNSIYVFELPPNAGFYGYPTNGNGPMQVNFTDTSVNLPTSWNWDFGDGQTSNQQNPLHTYGPVPVPTTYSVQLIASNAFGTSTATQTNYISLTEPPPVAGFYGTPTVGTGPFPVNFTDTSAWYPSSWDWDFGDGGTDTTQNPTHIYAAVVTPTCYDVRLIVSSFYGTSTITQTNYICAVNLPPNAGFYAIPTSGYGPLPVNFTDTSVYTPTSWDWDFGDGSTSNLSNPSHTYASVTVPTFYTVRLIDANVYGASTAIYTNYIYVTEPKPYPGFYATPTVAIGPITVNFVDTSANTPLTWNWDFGDGSTSNLQSPSHSYGAVTSPTYYNVQLVVSNIFGISTALKNNYIYVIDTASGKSPSLSNLPALKLFTGQTLADAFNLEDFNTGLKGVSYDIPVNFLGLSSLDGSTVNQNQYGSATGGSNLYQINTILGMSTSGNKVKYSTYKIQKLPKVGLSPGSSWDMNVANNTFDLNGLSIPPSFGNADALSVSNPGEISAEWIGNNVVRITSLGAFTGPVSVSVIASPMTVSPFGTDIDEEQIMVYSNLLSNSTFSTAQDIAVYSPLELAPNYPNLATQNWMSSYTDSAGVEADGVWQFTFADASTGAKATPSVPNWISMSDGQWYTIRMRVVADSPNGHGSYLFGYSNYIGSGLQCDIAGNVLFAVPTVWTWQETPMLVHGNTTTGYPQFQFKASGPGNVYVDEIQTINAAPTLVDAGRYPTPLKYPYGNFDVISDTTGWGPELYPGSVSMPGISVANGQLQVDFSGATTTNLIGFKWTANNGIVSPGVAYTQPVTVGREVGVRATVTKQSGDFDSLGIILVAAFGVQTSGQQDVGIAPSSLFATAGVGVIAEGTYRTVGTAVNPYYQFQFGLRSDQSGTLSVSDVDFDLDRDDPNYGDGTLFP